MKKKLIKLFTRTLLKHIETLLETREEKYLNHKNYTSKSNRDELLTCKKILEDTIKVKTSKETINFIEVWSRDVEWIDYESHDFIPFTKIFTKRILDFYYQNEESKEALKNEVLSFKFETLNLDLTKTILNETMIREHLREVVLTHDPASWEYVVEQSKLIQTTLIKYFEGLFTKQSQELKTLNQELELRVEEKNRELLYSIYYDKLTGLSNINAFERDTKELDKMSVALINIDGFGKLYSIYGHEFADEALRIVAQKFSQILAPLSLYKLYRYHGDRFLILSSEEKEGCNCLENIYKELLDVFEKETLKIKDETLSISFTAGISTCKEEPIQFAELAYQQAKENRNSYEIYNENSNALEEYKKHEFALNIVKYAIKHELVFPYFQLIRDNKDPKKRKYESLMRLEDPYGNVFSPFVFMDVAKDAKLYEGLSRIMMRKSIEAFENEDASFSINLEVEDVLNEKTMRYLYSLIQEHKVEHKIILEITESENIKDFKEVAKVFKCFKDLGVKVAIDDFGTGYSNFSYLTEFDFDFIKIDGSLIKNIHEDENAFIITQTVVNFAKKLNKEVIAEFIDKPEVQEVVENLGIDYSQGYLFSKPSPKIA